MAWGYNCVTTLVAQLWFLTSHTARAACGWVQGCWSGCGSSKAQDVPPVAVTSAKAGVPILSPGHSQRKEKAGVGGGGDFPGHQGTRVDRKGSASLSCLAYGSSEGLVPGLA